MMVQRKALLVTLAVATSTSAFVFPSRHAQRVSSDRYATQSPADDLELPLKVLMDKQTDGNAAIDESAHDEAAQKMIMDIPPSPSDSLLSQPSNTKSKAYTTVKTKPSKPFNPAHKEGILSPLVYAANSILGKEELNKLRAQVISLHSDIIKSFVDTADSELGKAVLRQLFVVTDRDNSGYLDKEEVSRALGLLGFKWLEDKHVSKIFERADLNDDGEISLEEFIEEAPKTLRVNLVKLAKNNGGDLGLLV
eukprot:CCRYP_020012-RA/>CCRYP_020012-RA protein AED:0.20 eAED:0.20 QI:0/-1/0/1/-1/1/1/0/250